MRSLTIIITALSLGLAQSEGDQQQDIQLFLDSRQFISEPDAHRFAQEYGPDAISVLLEYFGNEEHLELKRRMAAFILSAYGTQAAVAEQAFINYIENGLVGPLEHGQVKGMVTMLVATGKIGLQTGIDYLERLSQAAHWSTFSDEELPRLRRTELVDGQIVTIDEDADKAIARWREMAIMAIAMAGNAIADSALERLEADSSGRLFEITKLRREECQRRMRGDHFREWEEQRTAVPFAEP